MTPSCSSAPWQSPTWLQRSRAAFDADVVFSATGRTDLIISGSDAACRPFLSESGGHRWQRIPPTERKGRVHTTTVTVVVLPVITPNSTLKLADKDLSIETMRGSGAGGQHRNVTDSAVRMRHLPTGLEVRICSQRSQHRNKDLAREILTARVASAATAARCSGEAQSRKLLVGSGMRADKIKTYRCVDDQVVDHRSGARWTVREFLRGRIA